MAEIDIQGLWEKGKQISRSSEPEIDIDQAIKGKSRSTLFWIKVILWIEFWLNVVGSPFVLFMLRELNMNTELVFFLIVVIIYLIYYLFLIRAINRFSYLEDVKTSLKRLYGYLNFYLLHYKVLIWVIYPLSYIYGFVKGFEMNDGDAPSEPGEWAMVIGISIIVVGLLTLIANWMVNLIYGKKIKRLKGMVQELEAAE